MTPGPQAARRSAGYPDVLMYHSISTSAEPDPYLLRIHPDRLEAQLRQLRRMGLRGVPVAEALDAHARGSARGLAALTFDDGYRDFITEAMPLLERHGMRATAFIVSANLGGVNDWDDGPRLDLVTADDVRAIEAAGHEIGSHSHQHLHLTELTSEQVHFQAAESRRVLSEVVGHDIAGFCYPFGDFDDTTVAAVTAAGFDYACATDDYTAPGPHRVPRFNVAGTDGGLRLSLKVLRHRVRTRRAPAPTPVPG